MIEKIESVIKRMRWKAHFYLNKDKSEKASEKEPEEKQKNNYGFKSRHYPSQCAELKKFEEEVISIIHKIEFRTQKNDFQTKLREDIKNIKSSTDLLIFADKTNNIYKMDTEHYEKLLKDNITKDYKKAPPKLEKSINLESKYIAKSLKLSDRVDCLARTPAYITLKDHKENFSSNPTCRLINPSKNELGKISKYILQDINVQLLTKLKSMQWKNSDNVIQWFNNIPDKKNCKFIQLDIKEFYPSITEEALNKAISFANEHITIPDDNIRIIKHCRKSLLFNKDEAWKKKSKSNFDVTMGSYDGAQVCELVGLYILSLLEEFICQQDVGLYRDDGLIVVKKLNGKQTDQLRKDIIKCFKTVGFKIDITTNLSEVNFLDVTFNLLNGTYRPYRKPNDQILYINTLSNHPPQVIKQLPSSIEDRLSQNSSDNKIFDSVKKEYEEALQKSGYKTKLEYKHNHNDINENSNKTKKQRKRNIIWFNPPFNRDVRTNIAKTFLKLIDKHFPRSNKLHKIFNRNTVKVSYSCTENMEQIIKAHNKKVSSPKRSEELPCNCRGVCPLNGKCRKEDVVYGCAVSTSKVPLKYYIGIAKGEWKKRQKNHESSFRLEHHKTDTSLSKYVWDTKTSDNETPSLKWSILNSAPAYTNITKRCLLCLREKLAIAMYPHEEVLLNKKSEIISKCRHENAYLLYNYDEKG